MQASTGFIAYAVLFGFFNGLLIGICYQAPLFAAQMFFPDRKPLIRSILLFGSTFGIMVYSLLTTLWYERNKSGGAAAVRMMLNLVICFSLHTVLGSLLILIPTSAFAKKADRRAL